MNKQRSFGIILQYVQMFLNIVITLAYTPVMLRILGQNEYGIYNLASSIIAYLNIISLGFSSTYIRFYSKHKKDNDETAIKRLNGLYLLVFIIMGIISFVAGIILSSNVRLFYNDTYSDNDVRIASVLMVVLTINLSLSFPFSVFTSYITSQEKFIVQKLLNIGKTIFGPAVAIIFLFLGYRSIGMVVATTTVCFVVDTINLLYCLFKLKMKISFVHINVKLLKPIFVFSVFIAINQIIDQINWQTDKIILGKMINGSAVAIYAVGANINSMYLQFSTAISNVFTPRIHKIVNSDIPSNEKDKVLTDLFIKVGKIQWSVIGLILTGFIFFGKYFICKWAGPEYEDSYYVALLLICPVTVSLIQNIGIEIQRAKNKHQFRSIAYSIMAILNVGISILFTFLWGVIGTAVGTTISLILANGLLMNFYYHKYLGIDVIKFWRSILLTIPSFIIPVLLGIAISRFCSFNSLVDFIKMIVIYTLVYFVSLYVTATNKKEKDYIKRGIKMLVQ